MKWTNTLRVLAHIPIGWICVFCAQANPIVGLVFAFGWFIYELNEDFHIKDRTFIDVYGFLVGLFSGTVIYYLVFCDPLAYL